MKRDYNTSYPTPSNSAESKPTDGECQEELKKTRTECFMLATAVAKQRQVIDDTNQRIANLKETVRQLRDKNDKLQQQINSYPTPSKSAEGKSAEGKSAVIELRGELIKQMALNAHLTTVTESQLNTITEANNQITKLKDIVSSLRERNKSLQYQLDSYATYSDDSRARISVIQYRRMLGEERNNKNYFIHRLKKEVEKTTELAQAITNLKRRNKSLLGNFKALNNVNHDDLELAIGLFTELVKRVSIIMDRNKPDTTLDYKKTLDEVIQTINQQGSMINEIYTVIQKARTERS